MGFIYYNKFMAKFKIGDKVKLVASERDTSDQVREVLGIFEKKEGVFYDISSVEVDVMKKEMINGHMYVSEDQIRPLKKTEGKTLNEQEKGEE